MALARSFVPRRSATPNWKRGRGDSDREWLGLCGGQGPFSRGPNSWRCAGPFRGVCRYGDSSSSQSAWDLEPSWWGPFLNPLWIGPIPLEKDTQGHASLGRPLTNQAPGPGAPLPTRRGALRQARPRYGASVRRELPAGLLRPPSDWISYALWIAGMAFSKADAGRAFAAWDQGVDYVRQHRVHFFEGFLARDAGRLHTSDGDVGAALVLFADASLLSSVPETCRSGSSPWRVCRRCSRGSAASNRQRCSLARCHANRRASIRCPSSSWCATASATSSA
jgi:hypothetical protein